MLRINWKSISALMIILALHVPFKADAQKIPRPSKPSCNSGETCKEQAVNIFSDILDNADEILKAKGGRGDGYICFKLSQIISLYFDLKSVDFSVLPLSNLDRQKAFDALYTVGQINWPSEAFCGLNGSKTEDDNKFKNLAYITPFVKNLSRDASSGLSLLKPQQAQPAEKSNPAVR